MSEPDLRMFSPAAGRNRQPILDVLASILPTQARVLELASGSGEHAIHVARALPSVRWQPSDPDSTCRASIDAWRRHENLPNVLPPLDLDARSLPWTVDECDAVVAINMIHISPWPVTAALFAGAHGVLSAGGIVYLYGPYRIGGQHTAESNARFDASLRAQNPEWGVRDLDEVIRIAGDHDFEFEATVEMPVNNLSVLLRRAEPA